MRKNINQLILFLFLSSCSTTAFLKYEKESELRQNKEFEKQVVVKPTEEVAPESVPVGPQSPPKVDTPIVTDKASVLTTALNKKAEVPKVSRKKNKKNQDLAKVAEVKPVVRQPELENSEGFNGQRRPAVDPYRVGEKVVHSVRYFAAEAGQLTLEVKPFVQVNDKKSYNFLIALQTSSLFSKFYSVDDYVETYMDYENMVPHVFKLNVRETGKLSQANSYFDHNALKARYWEKKYTQKNGEEIIKKEWDLQTFSQNAFSGIFYMRIFNWKIGQQYSFRVADDEKNVVFKGTALQKEHISTEAGEFDAIKIKADIFSRGALTQAGNLYFWISDDDRKYVLKIEAEIKIGKLISEVIEIKPGN